jgi:hypothetical protein
VCQLCCGSRICVHQRIKTFCTECRGSSICVHGKRRYYCNECHGAGICTGGVARRSNTASILTPRALPSGRRATHPLHFRRVRATGRNLTDEPVRRSGGINAARRVPVHVPGEPRPVFRGARWFSPLDRLGVA